MTPEAVEAHVAERCEDARQNAMENLARAMKRLGELPDRIRAARSLVATLEAAGFPHTRVGWDEDVSVTVKVKELTKLHGVVGRMKAEDHSLSDAKKKLVTVSLSCVKYPILTVKYQRKLKPGGKCQITKTKHTTVSLSCGI
jgi:hypothetical protein